MTAAVPGPARRRQLAAATAAGSAVLAAALLALVEAGWGPLHRLDHGIVRRLNGFVSGRHVITLFWKGVTDAGAPFVWNTLATVAVIALVAARRDLRSAAFVAATMIGTAVVDHTVKSLVARPRPVVPVPVAHARGFSFPSGHAMTSLVAVGVVLVLVLPTLRRGRPLLLGIGIVVAAAVGVSRLMLGVHYPSDVVGGWLLGTAWLALMIAVFTPSVARSAGSPPRSAVPA